MKCFIKQGGLRPRSMLTERSPVKFLKHRIIDHGPRGEKGNLSVDILTHTFLERYISVLSESECLPLKKRARSPFWDQKGPKKGLI